MPWLGAVDKPLRLPRQSLARSSNLEHKGFAESVPFGLSDSVHVIDQLNVAASLRDIATREHSLLCTDHHFRWEAGDLSEKPCVIHEAWDVACDESVHHAANTDDFASEDTGIDRCFGVITHNAP